MTPKRDEFEEKLEAAGNGKLANEDNHYAWARWAREQTIKDVLEWMAKSVSTTQFGDNYSTFAPDQIAAFEEKFRMS